jgi:hypothetical protein
MANPFAQFAPNPAATAPPPAPAVAEPPNPFAQFAAQQPEDQPTDTWYTTVRGKRIQFNAPRGADKGTIRAAAKAAGVPDPENRSLTFAGKPEAVPTGPTAEQQANNYGPVGTNIHQGVDFVVPFVDELAAASNAAGNLILGDTNVRQNYMNNMDWLQQRAANSEAMYPEQATAGKIGATLATLPAAAEAKFLQGRNMLTTALKSSAFMGPYAAINTYGSNPVNDRLNGMALSGAIGSGLGLLAPLVAGTAGKVIGGAARRIGLPAAFRRLLGQPEEADQTAIDIIASRTAQDPNQMRAVAREMRDTGHEPALTNVVDESGRGVIGAAARRGGAGREMAQRAYESRALSVPERVDRNMQAVVEGTTDNPDVKAALRQPVDETTVRLQAERSAAMDAAMTPIRNNPVPLTKDVFDVLNTADGQRALGQAMRTVTDPAVLQQMKKLQSFVRSANKAIDPRLPPAVQESIINKLLADQPMTVDIADRVARKFGAMADMGSTPSDTAMALRNFKNVVRGAAKTASPEYSAALAKYGETSTSLDALQTGSEYLKPNTDEFVKRAGALSNTAAEGQPSDRQLAQQAARRAVQAATGENISAAPSVARKIAVAPEQSARNAALFGPIDADKLERAMAITVKDLRDYARIAPNTGSDTALKSADDRVLEHLAAGAAYAKSGHWAGAAMHTLRAIGMSDADATRIVELAVDPAQTDRLINMLEKSYGKQQAQKVARLIGLPITQSTSRAIGGSR